jgi:hypothetical protein
MGGGFNITEPINISKMYNNLELVEAFQLSNWFVYFDRLQGYNDIVAFEFSHKFQNVIN